MEAVGESSEGCMKSSATSHSDVQCVYRKSMDYTSLCDEANEI